VRYLLTGGKHVNKTLAIARQLLGKRVPAATVEVLLAYNNKSGVFYVVHAEFPKLELSAVQLSEVTRSSLLVSERVQLSVESQPVKRRLGGWREMTAS
jgi:O-acetyl-ADP-ribose deacetylase (regulator of RNase III)